MRRPCLFALALACLLFAGTAQAATISYQATFSNACAYCSGSSPGTGTFSMSWDDATFSANYTITYSGLSSNLQAIRFYDTSTGANYNGQIGPLFPEAGEELAGSLSGSLTWFSVYDGFVDAGTLGIGFATLTSTGYEIGGTVSVLPEPALGWMLSIGGAGWALGRGRRSGRA